MGRAPGRGRSGRWGGIVADLALMIAITLLPLLTLGAYLSYRAVREERTAIYATARKQAQETAQRADTLIVETRALLTILTQSPTLRAGDPAATRAYLLDIKMRFPYYDDLYAIDPGGSVYASAARPAGERVTVGDQPFFQAAVRDNRTVISDVIISRTTSRPVVVVAMPIPGGAGGGAVGPPTGAVAATLDLVLLQQWLDNRTLPPRTTITVVDDRGRVLARSLDPEGWVGRTIADVPTVRAAVDRREGIVEGADVDGVARLSGFATAREVPWFVLVGIPRDAVFAPLRREIELMVLRLLLAGLATAVLALVVVRRVVRPVQQLTAGARAIAGGDLAHRIPLHRRDELGQLALATNQMADALVGSLAAQRQAQERLEAAVAQVGRGLTSAVEPTALLTPLVEAAAGLTRADAGLLAFSDGSPPVVTGGLAQSDPALLDRLGARVPDAAAAGAPFSAADLRALGMASWLLAPVRVRDEALGTLVVFRAGAEGAREPAGGRGVAPFGEADERLLRTFADQVAVAIEQARLRTAVAQAEALRELHRLQTDFIATASHELRAPITGIKGYAAVLLRDDLPLDEATRRECLAGIERLTDRLAVQVRAFFDAMRAGEGRLGLRREPADLGALAAPVVHSFATRVTSHEFRLAVALGLPPALADPARVEDVLGNLLDNAVKYAPAGGPIAVEVGRADAATLLVTVRDEGIGIPPEEQERIFDRFYRLDQSATRHAGGAGLGLYLCRAYVTGMGGRLWVESRPGAGSAFRFTLPVAGAVGGGAAPANAAPGAAGVGAR